VQISSNRFADVIVAAIVGRVDHQSAAALEAGLTPLLDEALRDRDRALVLDFAHVDYISSVGLRVLMIAAKKLHPSGAKLAVAALQPVVGEIFTISRFDRVLGVYHSVRDALQQISADALESFDHSKPSAAA